MTKALDRGHRKTSIYLVRGQILAEQGRYGEAIKELDIALDLPRSYLSAAYAKSARAYAIGMDGDLEKALDDFKLAAIDIPDAGSLHYFRALCYQYHQHHAEAVEEMRKALAAKVPPLTRPKREAALRFIAVADSKPKTREPSDDDSKA